MKTVVFKNRRSNEKFVCDNVRDVRVIEGIEYLQVHRLDNPRNFLMRRDALEKVELSRAAR
jgi:hypothetical protein